MGSVGNQESYWDFKDNPLLSTDVSGTGGQAADWWREHDELSNTGSWEDDLSDDQRNAVETYAGSGYWDVAELYETEWDNMTDYQKKLVSNIYEALNKFELKKPITVNRMTSFKIFGKQFSSDTMTADEVKDYLRDNTSGGLLQNDGFMSFSTLSNGVNVAGSGLVIHLDVPKNTGAGAYISGIGGNYSEREYLVNTNSIMKFDIDSVRQVGSQVHVNAKLVGRAKMQTIDSKNTSEFRKRGKEKKPFLEI